MLPQPLPGAKVCLPNGLRYAVLAAAEDQRGTCGQAQAVACMQASMQAHVYSHTHGYTGVEEGC